MPNDGQSAVAADHAAELLELRVLDGPNRFFTRPAVKLEFGAATPGPAAEVAATAGLAIRRLHVALDFPAPRITLRTSADRLRVACEAANPIKNLKVRDGVFEKLSMDEVVPLLMLPVGLALRAA